MECLHWLLFAAALMVVFISGARALECYSCAYVPGKGQSACSDPWYSIRDTLNAVTGPPRRKCLDACVKIVVRSEGNYDSVVRTCGSPCNETVTGNTVMSCCTTDYCNGAKALTSNNFTFTLLRTLLLILIHWLLRSPS